MTDITGTAFDDNISGTEQPDLLRGLEGADLIFGGGGDDRIEGGEDDDNLQGQAGSDVVFGGEGDDSLWENGSESDQLFGEAGNDRLVYMAVISPAAHSALLDGGSDDDYLEYSAFGAEDTGTLIGGSGGDEIWVFGGGGVVAVDAGADADIVRLANGSTRSIVTLGGGADLLHLTTAGFNAGTAPSFSIADFEIGEAGDGLAIGEYLALALQGWNRDLNPFAGNYLRVVQRGSDAVLQFDRDGGGSASGFTDFVVFQGVTAANLTAHNLGGYAQDGSIADGLSITGTVDRDFLSGNSGSDLILGNLDNDILFGAAGNDRLEGGDGADSLDGETGDDILFGGGGDDFLTDTVDGSDRLFGQDGNDRLYIDRSGLLFSVPPEDVELDGGVGHDFIGYGALGRTDNVTVYGRLGNDQLVVAGGGRVVIDGGAGDDEITIDVSAREYSISLGSGADLLVLYHQPGFALRTFTVHDFRASEGDRIDLDVLLERVLTGWNPATNPFDGGFLKLTQSGADTRLLIDLNGGGDSYTLLGTLQNFSAHNLNSANLGFDPGIIAIAGTDGSDSLVGTPGNDELLGFAGDDFLVGGQGGDVLDGGTGADIFAYAGIIESTASAPDTIRGFQSGLDRIDLRNVLATSLDFVPAGALTTVTIGTLQGPMTIQVEGPVAGSDFLMPAGLVVGTPADNQLQGDGLNNIIDGRGGADVMAGGVGDDLYAIDDAGDSISEAPGEGIDTAYSAVNFSLSANVENLTLTGTLALNGTGNALDNLIIGNAAANLLDGGTGADGMTGGDGNDTFVVDNAGDTIGEADSGGTDRVQSAITYTLAANIENLTLTGTGAINGTGNALVNVVLGNSAANILNGGFGADTMQGGAGNDTYIVDNALDRAVELNAADGVDTVQSSVAFTLVGHVENLTLTGGGTTNATGNAFANALIGNAQANTLDGGAGADAMAGGLGNDTYIVDNAGDLVTEAVGAGTDLVRSALSHTLSANVETSRPHRGDVDQRHRQRAGQQPYRQWRR